MSRKLVLLAFLSLLVVTALVAQTMSSQSLCNKQCLIPQSGTVYYPDVSVDRMLAETVHNNDTGLNYTTIQEAVNAPETVNGHLISVDAGIFNENVVINKNITLTGENVDTAIINGSVTVYYDTYGVNLTEFTIEKGIEVRASSALIRNNRITSNGIFVSGGSGNRVIDNNISNANIGIYLSGGENAALINNKVNNCSEEGIYISGTQHYLRNNAMSDNKYGLTINGWELPDFLHDIDTSNMINGKPIYYLVNQTNTLLGPANFTSIGYLALVNSADITTRDLKLENETVGLLLAFTNRSLVTNLESANNRVGLNMVGCYNNVIRENTFTLNQWHGISLSSCSDNFITRNTFLDNLRGMWLCESGNNNITANDFLKNSVGISFDCPGKLPPRNRIYHNNFMQNTVQVTHNTAAGPFYDDWDNSNEGNYWSNYTGVDSDHDGIGDTEHVIDENNTDHHPLMGMFTDFNVTSELHVQTICNSTITDFRFNGSAINFNVTGVSDTAGFCRICIPKALINETYRVFVNGTEILPAPLPLPCSNSTHNYLYFTYNHSTEEIVIIPDFPSFLIVLLFMLATLLVIIMYRKNRSLPILVYN